MVSPILLLALWEVRARLGFIDTRFFPAPTAVVGHVIEKGWDGSLWMNTGACLYSTHPSLRLSH